MISLNQLAITSTLLLSLTTPAFADTLVTFEDVQVKYEESPLYGTALLDNGYGGISGWSAIGKVYGYADGYNQDIGANLFYGSDGELTFDKAPVVFKGTYYKSYTADPMLTSIELFYQGVSVHSILDPRASGGLVWLSSGYSGLVDKIIIRGGIEGYAIDNLTYDTVIAVPEPSSTALWLLGGLVVFGWICGRQSNWV